MKRLFAICMITFSLAACGNNSGDTTTTDSTTSPGNDASGGTTPSITSGNTASRQGQEIPQDSVETTADSTGNIKAGDTTKK